MKLWVGKKLYYAMGWSLIAMRGPLPKYIYKRRYIIPMGLPALVSAGPATDSFLVGVLLQPPAVMESHPGWTLRYNAMLAIYYITLH